ncbi:hypothetical protein [Amycolatopsis sp. lyj-108]|uniref:hypothetical protein n=1 Tax=Amycolatopsis sp. lyj-108 TaxID=2789286 RepID=UPI00397D33A3
MSHRTDMPGEEEVRQAAQEVIAQTKETGHRPSVLAVARRFDLSNTTFRRNFPEIARELSELRRTPTPGVEGPPDAKRYVTLQEKNAALRQDNARLKEHLELAVANIMRLTIENRQLRDDLEAASNITRIGRGDARTGDTRVEGADWPSS